MAGESISTNEFDVAIVGGGIVGAGIFRDHALHNMSSIIIDQADFNSQTSQGSSKMLHGGIRYLENFDFALVFEALREKNLWLRLTPHISKEIPFYLPVYKHSKWPLFLMKVGLFIYDLLSLFKNSPHKTYSKKRTLELIPGLNPKDLKGTGLYFDGVVDDSKLGLECIYDGLNNKKCKALNYTKVISVKKVGDVFELKLEDVLNAKLTVVKAKKVVFATGPFTDQTMKMLNIPWDPVILPSKGTHLWIKKDVLPIKDAIVLQTKDGRVIFVIPQRGTILVGTTEIPLDPNTPMLNIQPTPEEIAYLKKNILEYFPEHPIQDEDILGSFAAVRPLVKAGTSSSKTSRNHKIFRPQEGLYVIVGGKYTTFRKMAEDLNKKLFRDMGKAYNKKLSLKPLKSISIVKDPLERKITKQDIENILAHEHVRTKEDLLQRRLSLPSLQQLDNQEIKEIIENIKLESFRNPH